MGFWGPLYYNCKGLLATSDLASTKGGQRLSFSANQTGHPSKSIAGAQNASLLRHREGLPGAYGASARSIELGLRNFICRKELRKPQCLTIYLTSSLAELAGRIQPATSLTSLRILIPENRVVFFSVLYAAYCSRPVASPSNVAQNYPDGSPVPPITKQGHLPHRLLLLPRPTSCSDLQKFPLTPAEGARRSIPSRCMYLGQEYLKSAVHLSVYMSMPMHMCMCMNMCIYVCTYIICG